MKQLYILLVTVFIGPGFIGNAQDTLPFREEVMAIRQKYDTLWDSSKETIVFTGSSSIRLWTNLDTIIPQYQIVNSGFGGSRASDLLLYSDELILKYRPKKVFIYEGDNDIYDNRKLRKIMVDIEEIIKKIKEANHATEIVLIAAKPSIARWHLKRKYKRLNRKLYRLSKMDPTMKYADVWDTMLDRRRVREDIFIEDGLHMNAKGYELWYEVIKNYID